MIFLNGNIHQKGFVWISKPLQDLVVESKAKGARSCCARVGAGQFRTGDDRGRSHVERK